MIKKYQNEVMILLIAVCYTSLPVFIQILVNNHVSLFYQNVVRTIIALIILAPVLVFFTKESLWLSKKEFKYILPNALILLGAFITISLAIYLGTSVAKATALVYAYSISVVILNYLIFKVKPTLKHIIAVTLSLISVALILQVWTISDISSLHRGDLFALANSVFFGLMIVFGKKVRVDLKISSFRSTFLSLLLLLPLFVILSLLLYTVFHISLFSYQDHVHTIVTNLPSLAGLALFATVLPLILIYKSITKVNPTVASILLFTELIWISIAGVVFFGQELSVWTIVGIIGILLSVLLI